jgi:hypothetical protein
MKAEAREIKVLLQTRTIPLPQEKKTRNHPRPTQKNQPRLPQRNSALDQPSPHGAETQHRTTAYIEGTTEKQVPQYTLNYTPSPNERT